MKTKTYSTLANAYAAAAKAGARPFDITNYDGMVTRVITTAYKRANDRTVALWNLVTYENTLCALEQVTAQDGKTAYKWTAIGTFDSEGLLYPAHKEADAPASKPTEDKPAPRKRTRKPADGKGKPAQDTKPAWQTEIDAHAGRGRASNKAVASILRKHNMSAQIGSEGWTYWESVR